MGQLVLTTLVDDIDGTEADETVEFGFDGAVFEIDLSEEHARGLRETLSSYADHARLLVKPKAGKKKATTAPKRRQRGDAPDPSVIRAWAIEQGLEVSARGRLNKQIVDAYFAGH